MSLIVFVLYDINNYPPELASRSTINSAVLLIPRCRVFGSAPNMILVLSLNTISVADNGVLISELLYP
jgi:hypothetical protein